ncbi:MAG TPA: helix-turn-helix domain-containing protein [Thermoplasmata archaeon]|nr:helix-turn-helix domain-containing protein [Thermoplasmata archaeon]
MPPRTAEAPVEGMARAPGGLPGPARIVPRVAADERIRQFTEEATRFSHDFAEFAGPGSRPDPLRASVINVDLAKSLFSKWVIEILLLLYAQSELGFQELRRSLGTISPRVLSQKLRLLEDRTLLRRTVLPTRPARVHYSLTEDGLVLAKLGEPVFIFLRYRRDARRPGRKSRGRGPANGGRGPIAELRALGHR